MNCSQKRSIQLLGFSEEKTNFWYVSNCASSTKDEICCVRRAHYHTHWVHFVCPRCVSVCRSCCESWIICGVYPLHKCSFQGFGKSPCTGNKKLQCSDPVLAHISQNIVEHSGNKKEKKKKLPSSGNSACRLTPHRHRQSSLSPLALFHFCSPRLHIPLSCARSYFFLSGFLLTWFNFSHPLVVK